MHLFEKKKMSYNVDQFNASLLNKHIIIIIINTFKKMNGNICFVCKIMLHTKIN